MCVQRHGGQLAHAVSRPVLSSSRWYAKTKRISRSRSASSISSNSNAYVSLSTKRIVQAWRPASWEPGAYTLVKFEFKEQGSQTRVILDHTGFREGDFGHFDSGWRLHYWERLARYLG